ncbi:membrane protein DedA with SNARE-associated domain [Sphingomonas faeni]|nr:membrane protein DedA with SNARE-associated domain [Sphingomonas faeni]
MGMRQRSFQIANIVSAVIWVPALFAPGYRGTVAWWGERH